jgi:toxin ParE1/3/4
VNRRLLLSPGAESDLLDVWSYTAEHFGVLQADRYLEQLVAGLRSCASRPNRGRRRDDLRPGYRSVLLARHVAFYTVRDDAIVVQRVLHGSMDPDQNLDDD